jgi:hypothetical protein
MYVKATLKVVNSFNERNNVLLGYKNVGTPSIGDVFISYDHLNS